MQSIYRPNTNRNCGFMSKDEESTLRVPHEQRSVLAAIIVYGISTRRLLSRAEDLLYRSHGLFQRFKAKLLADSNRPDAPVISLGECNGKERPFLYKAFNSSYLYRKKFLICSKNLELSSLGRWGVLNGLLNELNGRLGLFPHRSPIQADEPRHLEYILKSRLVEAWYTNRFSQNTTCKAVKISARSWMPFTTRFRPIPYFFLSSRMRQISIGTIIFPSCTAFGRPFYSDPANMKGILFSNMLTCR